MYRDGRGVPLNKAEALHILSNESVSKDADASYLHASMLLETSTGSSKNLKNGTKVMRLLKLAAAENHAFAQYLLACQLNGVYLKQKFALLKSASKINANAMFKLAYMFADGEGVTRDDKEAAKLLMSAVSKGHLESHCRLADMLEHGRGVVQSIELAARLYGQAAEKQNAVALSNLARMHTHGLGVIQSHSEAFTYCRLAAVK
jgi:TPR repeat protein